MSGFSIRDIAAILSGSMIGGAELVLPEFCPGMDPKELTASLLADKRLVDIMEEHLNRLTLPPVVTL